MWSILLVSFLIGRPVLAAAAELPAVIAGTIIDQSSARLPGAVVDLHVAAGALVHT